MNWLVKTALRVDVLSNRDDGTLKVAIDGKVYWYRGEKRSRDTVDFYCRKGWYGKAIQYLKTHFQLLETPTGVQV